MNAHVPSSPANAGAPGAGCEGVNQCAYQLPPVLISQFCPYKYQLYFAQNYMAHIHSPKVIAASLLFVIYSLIGNCSYASSVPLSAVLAVNGSLSQEMAKRNGTLKYLYLAPIDSGYLAISKDDKLSCIVKISSAKPYAHQGPLKCSRDAREFKTISEIEYEAKDAKWQAFTFK
jgi:hypothetical protein